MVVAAIVSVLGMVAVPALARVRTRAKTAAIVNDFRVFGAAFDTYAQERGRWPNESTTGATPAGMNTYLNLTAWRRITPMGGKYDWERNQRHMGVRYTAAIAIKAAAGAPLPLDPNQLLDIDRFMDDGNLSAGSFRTGTGFCPLFVIQP